MFIFIASVTIFQFLIGSLAIYLTTKIIFKTAETKFLTAVKVSFIILLYGVLTQALLFIFSPKMSDDVVKTFVSNVGVNLTALFMIVTGVAAIFELILSYFLFKKYYSFTFFRNIKALIVMNILVVIFSLLFTLPVRSFVAQPFIVAGSTMEPALKSGEYLFIKLYDKNYGIGDVVVFRNPKNKKYLIKRIVDVSANNQYIVVGDGQKDSQAPDTIKKDWILGKYWFSPFEN